MNKNILIGVLVVVVIGLGIIGWLYWDAQRNIIVEKWDVPEISTTPSSSATQSVKQSIAVIYPNGREQLEFGDRVSIKWSPKNISSTESVQISLVYGTDGPSEVIARVKNTGIYIWKIDNLPAPIPPSSQGYSIKIEYPVNESYECYDDPSCLYKPLAADSSDGLFTISIKQASQNYQQQQNQDQIKNDVRKIESYQTLFETMKGYYANSSTQLNAEFQGQLPQPPTGVVYLTNVVKSCAEGAYLTTIGLKNPYCLDNKTGAEL